MDAIPDFPDFFAEYRARLSEALDCLSPQDALTVLRSLLIDKVRDFDAVAPSLLGAVEMQAWVNHAAVARRAGQRC